MKVLFSLLVFLCSLFANIPSGAYDAQDHRIAKIVEGTTTTYLVDPNTPYARVIHESRDNGTEIDYSYGLRLLGDGEHTFLGDALGSTRALVDSSGALTDTYTYTPYGKLSSHEGTSENSFLFTGEQYDLEAGLYYLRARYYSPELARFLSRDTYEGTLTDPLSQNAYLYARGNPAVYVDPSGHMNMLSVNYNLSIENILINTRTHILGLAREGFYKEFGCDLMAYMVEEAAREGIYIFLTNNIPYVGQSKDIDTRLKQHLRTRLAQMEDVLGRFHFEGLGGDKNKYLRETIEQIILDAVGGVEHTDNKRNPIGKARRHKIPEYIEKIKKILCKGK